MICHQGRASIFIYLLTCLLILNVLTNDNSSTYSPPYDNKTIYFTIGGTFCQDKRTCGRNQNGTFPVKTCYCDNVCHILKDCCWDYKSTIDVSNELGKYSKEQFSCIERPELLKNNHYGIAVIDKCASNWIDIDVLTKCENTKNSTDILLYLPVTESVTSVMFHNIYCALCNFVYDFKVWKAEIKCPNGTKAHDNLGNPNCKISFITPDPTIKARQCSLENVIGQCLPEVTDEELKQNCTNGDYSLVNNNVSTFRNQYCAFCNGLNANGESIFCKDYVKVKQISGMPDFRYYNLGVLVDLNTGNNESPIDYVLQRDIHKCVDDEIFDPFTETCRQIMCVFPYIARHGRCENVITTSNDTLKKPSTLESNATFFNDCKKLARFNATEFEITNTTVVFIFSLNKAFSNESFHQSGSDVFICLERNKICLHFCNPIQEMFMFTKAENILTLICLIISLLSLMVTFVVYICFPQLLNIPGKILISLVGSLFVAQLLFLISSEMKYMPEICQTVSILVHYFYLAAFCWMNIIALDLWMTFSNKFISMVSGDKSQRLRLYNVYAWLIPLVIVLIAVILDNVDFDNKYESLKPKYGHGICWITSRDALLVFFVGPLALFKLFDSVAFIVTAIHIIKGKRQGAMATQKKNACSFFINLKLSLVMGLTWVFAFVANVFDNPALWYLFIIFNGLQGLFICLSFLCTKKVNGILKEKYEMISKSSDSSASTQLTSYQRKSGVS